jgi:predicted alpha/beta-fold hydrolase
MGYGLSVVGLFLLSCCKVFAYDHLVVLSHGLHGSRHDLTYLARKLEDSGMIVYRSFGNEYLESHHGVREGATRLANEVWGVVRNHSTASKISFVGNSLGGLYCRYAIKELYDNTTGLIAGLQPVSFMVSVWQRMYYSAVRSL